MVEILGDSGPLEIGITVGYECQDEFMKSSFTHIPSFTVVFQMTEPPKGVEAGVLPEVTLNPLGL